MWLERVERIAELLRIQQMLQGGYPALARVWVGDRLDKLQRDDPG